MTDALGTPRSVLLLGGTSDIALATARRVERGVEHVTLTARPFERRTAAAAQLQALGCTVSELDFDARAPRAHAGVVEAAAASRDVDVAVVASGVLGDGRSPWTAVEAALAVAETNYVAAVSCGVTLVDDGRTRGRTPGRQPRAGRRHLGRCGRTRRAAGLGALADALGDVRFAPPAAAGSSPAADLSVRTQILRFLLVGAGTALAYYGVYRLLALDVPVTPAKTAGFVVGTTLSYLVHRAWTFEAAHHAVGRFLALYGVTLVANLLMSKGALAVLSGMAGSITVAWLLAQAVASTLNFLGMRYVLFAEPAVISHG